MIVAMADDQGIDTPYALAAQKGDDHCRPGIEGVCAAEIQELAAARGISGYCKAMPDAVYISFQPHEPDGWRVCSVRHALPS